MAEAKIHILDCGSDVVGVGRLVETLTRALEAEQDIGPRGHHIRAGGLALEHLHQEMLRAAQALPNDPRLRAHMDQMSLAIKQLITVASNY